MRKDERRFLILVTLSLVLISLAVALRVTTKIGLVAAPDWVFYGLAGAGVVTAIEVAPVYVWVPVGALALLVASMAAGSGKNLVLGSNGASALNALNRTGLDQETFKAKHSVYAESASQLPGSAALEARGIEVEMVRGAAKPRYGFVVYATDRRSGIVCGIAFGKPDRDAPAFPGKPLCGRKREYISLRRLESR